MDGDGDTDLLVASYISLHQYDVAWYPNDGTGLFGGGNVVDTLVDTQGAIPFDLDGDGDLDIVTATYGSLLWYENAGDGMFGEEQFIAASGCTPASLNIVDVDGDDDPDVLAACLWVGKIAWYENRLNGNTTTVSAPVTPPGLEQSYPNPSRQQTTVAFTLAQRESVRLQIFDLLGREMLRLVDPNASAGRHRVLVETASWPAGVYLYRLQTPSFSETHQLVVVK